MVPNKNFSTYQSSLKKNFWDFWFLGWFSMTMFGFFVYPAMIFYVMFHTHFWFVGLVYVLWMYYDRETAHSGGRKIEFLRKITGGEFTRPYFPVQLIKTVDLPPTKNYMFAGFPHGMFNVGGVVNFVKETETFEKLFPDLDLYTMTLSFNFNIPILRELFLTLGMVAVSERSILSVLKKKGTGTVCYVVVGGAAETLYSVPNEYRLVLQNRKGFVRLAIKTGSALVPVFSFGENDVYYQIRNKWLNNINKWIYKKTGLAPCISIGRMFGPFPTIFPRKCPINTVIGSPIDVPKVKNPSKELVDEYHAKFKIELEKLFHNYKKDYDPRGNNAKMVFV